MKKYVMIVNAARCNQCYACSLACRDEHFLNDFSPISAPQQELDEHWLDLRVEERGSGSKVRVNCVPETCRHCETPDCAKKSAAVYKREDGIVIIDPEKAKGDRELLNACPFGAIRWNAELELPQKCTLCAHLLDKGAKEPRCVEACPNGTLTFGDLNDPESEVSKLAAEYPEIAKQGGIVRYVNLPGRFIAGTVYFSDREEVAEGVVVTLLQNGVSAKTTTDGFGDFRFDDLPEGAEYVLKLELTGRPAKELNVKTDTDVCFEEVLI